MNRLLLISLFALFVSCTGSRVDDNYDERLVKQIDSIVYSNRSIEALVEVLGRFENEDNKYGIVASCRELGRSYRNASKFSEAIDIHKKGLCAAQQICDTIQIIQALNNIGTDYRRMGVLDEASSYHYQALTYSDNYSDKVSNVAVKNRVVSLNGIGNVQLSLGNPDVADSVFRLALKGETSLGSLVGQAINYANIGAILEEKGQVDSARFFYAKSLECNEAAGSALGISLCHTHFGRLAENAGRLDEAVAEYKKAYDIMKDSSDKWHWLESCLSLSRVYATKGNLSLAWTYLDQAKKAAEKISSLGPLADVYRQEYSLYERMGDHSKALNAYIKSSEYSRQQANEKNITHMQNVRVKYERETKQAEIKLIQNTYQMQQHTRNMVLGTTLVVLILALIAIAFLIYIIYLRSKNQKMMNEVEKMRTTFFTNITHEFRTPLTVIISAVNDIRSRNKADKVLQRDSADILRHSKGLLDLVGQVLDVAKMTSGAQIRHPEMKRGDVVGFVAMICERYTEYAAAQDMNFVYAFDCDHIEMDFIPEYMKRIVQNLLSNAIKFSNPGSDILLSIKTSEAGDQLSIYVCDSGIGMDMQQKQNIFTPFYQAPDSDRRLLGSGIGLSLVKLSAEAMGGWVEVHSFKGEGSVFIVHLPIKCSGEAVASLDMSNYSPDLYVGESSEKLSDECDSDPNATRILIVEDTPEVARWQMRQLNPLYNFYFAADGAEGLEKAKEIVPDLIITDIMMPVMDGYQLCRSIRESEMLCHIPVIMVTAKVNPEDKLKGLEAGADAYLEKPFNPEELSLRVEKLLQQREMLKRKFTDSQDGGEIIPAEISVSDRDFIEKLSSVIHDHISKGKLDYDELASDFFVGKTQLNRKIKAVTGYTTTEYILQIRVSMAKQLLVKTDFSIGEIASRVGIDDVAYFSSIFRKATGKTPTAYRNR